MLAIENPCRREDALQLVHLYGERVKGNKDASGFWAVGVAF